MKYPDNTPKSLYRGSFRDPVPDRVKSSVPTSTLTYDEILPTHLFPSIEGQPVRGLQTPVSRQRSNRKFQESNDPEDLLHTGTIEETLGPTEEKERSRLLRKETELQENM